MVRGQTDSREPLCRADDIQDPGSMGLNVEIGGEQRRVILVRRGAEFFAYLNSCPHTGAPLDMRPGKFLNLEKTHILCANHGALFDMENGFCLRGPCVGKSLEKIPVEVLAGGLYLAS